MFDTLLTRIVVVVVGLFVLGALREVLGGETARSLKWPSLGLSQDTKTVLWWVYGIQAVVVAAWFSGAIVRGEQSPFIWEEFQSALSRFGLADALLAAYLYVVFYSAFLVPLCLVAIWGHKSHRTKQVASGKAVAFAIEQQKLNPNAKLEACFTSKREADRYLATSVDGVLVSNPERDVFLVFSGDLAPRRMR
jgi:hypothetical protein